MLNMDEIHKEIKRLEECKYTTQDICNKLAILYIIKDHCCKEEEKSGNGTMTKTMSTGMMNSMPAPAMSSPSMTEK